MHIKNDLRHAPLRKHRLYVAVPLFTLCIAISFGYGALEALRGRIERAAGNGQGTLIEGSGSYTQSGTTVQLQSGQALVAARGIARVQAGGFDARGWNGAFDVTLQGDALDVAAITTPVLVRAADARLWLIPVGVQQRVSVSSPVFGDDAAGWIAARQPAPLPTHYLQEHLPDARRLMEETSLAFVVPAPVLRTPLAADVLQFAAARDRAAEEGRASMLHALHRALYVGDIEAARAVLRATMHGAALTGSGADALLPELLSLAQHTSVQPLLTPLFARTPDHLLLALLHPSLRGHAWMLPWPVEMGSEERIAALMALPAADHGQDAVPELAVERWGVLWSELLATIELPVAADAVLVPLEAQISSLEQRGYPERARHYADVILDVFSASPQMQPHAAAALDRLEGIAAGGRVVTEPVTVSMQQEDVSVSSSSAAAPDAQQAATLEQTVRTMLNEAGCMFTSRTVIRALTAERVAVENVVVGTTGGDRMINFQYDAAADTVVDIQKDGKILPYSLPLAEYLAWVREG